MSQVSQLNLYIQVIDSKKPTMSEIVKSGDSELSNSTTVEVQESRSSPKPIGPVKTVTPQLTKVITVLCKYFKNKFQKISKKNKFKKKIIQKIYRRFLTFRFLGT